MFSLATSQCVCARQMLDWNHQNSVTRLSMHKLVILVTHASQLHLTRLHHCLSNYCICHIYIVGGGCACVCVSVGVCERKFQCLFWFWAGFSNYRLLHKLLLELVVEHLQAPPSLPMNTENAHPKATKLLENIVSTGNNVPKFHNPSRLTDR